VTFPRGFDDCPQGRARLMRPLYPAAGWLLYGALRPVAGLLPDRWAAQAAAIAARANHPEIWQGIDGRDLARAWAALVLLNLLLYGAALLLVHRALLALVDRPLALALASLPALHFNVVDFLLVPSTEPFNLLVAALALHAAAVTWARGRAGLGGAALLGLCQLGKGLAYPVLSWAWALGTRTGVSGGPAESSPAPSRRRAGRVALALALFAAPALAYLAFVRALGLAVTYPETEQYRQVVWMLDYAREGRWASIPARWADGLAWHALHVLQGFGPALIVALAALLRRGGRPAAIPPAFLRHLVVYTATCAAFWCLVGYLQPRLAVGQLPAVVVLLGAAAARASDRPARWAWAAVALMAAARAAGLNAV
jgi:hypothetical protein